MSSWSFKVQGISDIWRAAVTHGGKLLGHRTWNCLCKHRLLYGRLKLAFFEVALLEASTSNQDTAVVLFRMPS